MINADENLKTRVSTCPGECDTSEDEGESRPESWSEKPTEWSGEENAHDGVEIGEEYWIARAIKQWAKEPLDKHPMKPWTIDDYDGMTVTRN